MSAKVCGIVSYRPHQWLLPVGHRPNPDAEPHPPLVLGFHVYGKIVQVLSLFAVGTQ